MSNKDSKKTFQKKKRRLSQHEKRMKAIAEARIRAFQNRHRDERQKLQAEDLSPSEQRHWEMFAESEMDRMWNGKSTRWR